MRFLAYPAILIVGPDGTSLTGRTGRRRRAIATRTCGHRRDRQRLHAVGNGGYRLDVASILRSSEAAGELGSVHRGDIVVGRQELNIVHSLRKDMVKQSSSLGIGRTRHDGVGRDGAYSSLVSVATTASARLHCRRHLCFALRHALPSASIQLSCCTPTKMAPVVVVDSLPTFVSPDVHREMVASTPASFNDIPPVLRHKEENVSVKLDPPLPEFTADDCANGSLYVIEKYVLRVIANLQYVDRAISLLIFMSSTGKGLQVEYRSITLHAISRAENVPSIYCQLDESPNDATAANEDAEISDMRELIIIPKAAESRTFSASLSLLSSYTCTAVEPIFEALSYCASLHPDPMDENDMDDDDDAFIDADENSPFETFNGTDGEELSEVGRVRSDFINNSRFAPY